MSVRPAKKVALLVESSRSYGRGLLRGIARFARTRAHWSMRHQEMQIDAAAPKWLQRWGADGILARIDSQSMVKAVRRLGIPTIDLRCRHEIQNVPRYETDDRKVVQLALEHFLERGFTRFAYCGFAGVNYSVRRLQFFREELSQRGIQPRVYESPRRHVSGTPAAEKFGMLDERHVGDWLSTLVFPIALLCCNDIRAQQVMNVCRALGILVPDQIAVMGIDDDDVICPLCDPPLSSVRPNTERLGYEAAKALDAMMAGTAPPAPHSLVLIPPMGVSSRQSTQVYVVDDPEVARACQLIRLNACAGMNVAELAQMMSISRRQLERRFRTALKTTPLREITRHRVQRIQELLTESNMTLEHIAELVGYSHPERLSFVFKRETGETPSQYRRRMQARQFPQP